MNRFQLDLSHDQKTKSLHRNKACLNCRTRKTKCDATKPICSACQRLGTQYHSQCQYDQPPKWLESVVAGKNRNAEQNKIIELESKLHQLNQKLISLHSINKKQTTTYPFLPSPTPSISSSSLPDPPSSSPPLLQPNYSTDSFLLVSEPNWFPHLPPRHTCKALIKAFFNRPLSPFTLVEPVSLQSRINLSSSDPNFPEPALIHAVCAIGSQYLAIQDLYPPYWSPLSSPPHRHHAWWAEHLLNDGITSYNNLKLDPSRLIQLAEAAVLCCQYYTLVGKPLMIWKSLGYSIRLATLVGLHQPPTYGLNLNHSSHPLPVANPSLEDELVSLWPDEISLIENAPDHRIQHYRTILWWYVFCCDKMCAAAGGFASTVDEKDCLVPIYTPPPMPPSSTTSLGGEELSVMMSSNKLFINNTQHQASLYLPKSPGFFFYHQIGDFDSLQLLIKAAILLGRVNTSLYQRSHPAKSTYQIKQEYDELSKLIWGLFNSIPDGLKNPFRLNQSGHLDSCLLSAHTLIHTALIQMNEDLVEINPRDQGSDQPDQEDDEDEKEEHLKICKQSGKILIEWFLELIKWKNLGLIHIDLGDVLCGNPALNFGLSVALRTHCRFIAIYKYKTACASKNTSKNKLAYLEHLQFQINLILSHLKGSQKMPLEGRVVELITSLLNSPWTLLPKKKTKSSSPTLSTVATITQQQNQMSQAEIVDISKNTNALNNYYNPNKKTKMGINKSSDTKRGLEDGYPLYNRCKSHLSASTDTAGFESMVSNFALAKLLNSQI